jgi:putative hemolysin
MNPLPLLSVGMLLGAGAFNTLLRSLRFSGEAGLSRLSEKQPKFARAEKRWGAKWMEIISVITLLAVCCQIGTIWASVTLFNLYLVPDATGLVVVGLYTLLNIALTRTVPGVVAEHYADRITLAMLPLCGLLYWLLFPFAFLLGGIERILHLRLAGNPEQGNRPSAEDEILTLVDQSSNHDLDEDERDFIRSALEFGETITREIMTPRVRMVGLEDTLSVSEALNIVKDSPYSRFPLYHDDFDEILGMVHVKDLIRAIANGRTDDPLTRVMSPSIFVPESMLISDLLRQMKQKKVHTAIAVDEYGGTAGIITLEDILEELVGEIEDEHDRENKPFNRISEGVYQVDASMNIDELNEELDLELPEREEYDSVAGYLLYTLGRIPATGEVFPAPGCEIRIQSATTRKIQTLTLHLEPKA